MSRVIDPGIGELFDRLSVLALKIQAGGVRDRDVTHFREERAAIVARLRQRVPGGKDWLESYSELAATNALLWQAEDEMRHYRNEGQTIHNRDDIVDCAFRIQELNDARAQLVRGLNGLTGKPAPAEKL